MRRRAASAARPPPETAVPNSLNSPEVGGVSVAKTLSNVLFPAPLAPSSATNRPTGTWRATSSSTGRSSIHFASADVPPASAADATSAGVKGPDWATAADMGAPLLSAMGHFPPATDRGLAGDAERAGGGGGGRV